MRLFRNPEFKRSLLIFLAATAAFSAAGLLLGRALTPSYGSPDYGAPSLGALLALWALLIGLICTGLFVFFTAKRYRRIRKMSQCIDALLHGDKSLHFPDYQEGELSILKVEIDKMVLRLQEQSEHLQREKGHLAASMADISHQLRTPMTSLRLVLTLLSEPELAAGKRTELLRQMSMLLNRIDWLIEALLKVSRLDAGTVEFKLQPAAVSQIVRAAAGPLEIPMELRGQRLHFREQTGRETFWVDTAWTVEAVANILKNCMEHTPEGGEILVSASQNAIYTELIIQDNGPGFAPEDIPHLFERFYKGKNSSQQSVGIGLALARMILVRENASVKAENAPEGGARFVLHFYRDLSGQADKGPALTETPL